MCRHLRSELRAAAKGLEEHKERGSGQHEGFRVYRGWGSVGGSSILAEAGSILKPRSDRANIKPHERSPTPSATPVYPHNAAVFIPLSWKRKPVTL